MCISHFKSVYFEMLFQIIEGIIPAVSALIYDGTKKRHIGAGNKHHAIVPNVAHQFHIYLSRTHDIPDLVFPYQKCTAIMQAVHRKIELASCRIMA